MQSEPAMSEVDQFSLRVIMEETHTKHKDTIP